MKDGKKVDVPIYNFVTHRREEKTMSMYGANVLIFEGILSFHNKQVKHMNLEQVEGGRSSYFPHDMPYFFNRCWTF